MYCGVDVPGYLRYLKEWSYVTSQLPKKTDLVIIVDASSETLFEKIKFDENHSSYRSTKKIVIDHHAITTSDIDCELLINDLTKSSTSEIIFDISKHLGWHITVPAGDAILTGILGDTQGLTNGSTSSDTYRKVASLIDLGVSRTELENRRKEFSKLSEELLVFKGELLQRVEFFLNSKLAIISVNQAEINEFSAQYNPSALVIPDILQVESLAVVCFIKAYDSGRVTGTIRSNIGYPISGAIAEKMDGGGHQFAAGFKQEDSTRDVIIKQIVSITQGAIDNLNE